MTTHSPSYGWPRWAMMICTSGKRIATGSRCRGSVHSSGAWATNVVPVCSSTGRRCRWAYRQSGSSRGSSGRKPAYIGISLMPRRPAPGGRTRISASQPRCVGSSDRKPISRSGCGGDVVGHVRVIDPQPAQPRLAAEDDRPDRLAGRSGVVLEADRQIDLDPRLGPLGLLAEVVAEMRPENSRRGCERR